MGLPRSTLPQIIATIQHISTFADTIPKLDQGYQKNRVRVLCYEALIPNQMLLSGSIYLAFRIFLFASTLSFKNYFFLGHTTKRKLALSSQVEIQARPFWESRQPCIYKLLYLPFIIIFLEYFKGSYFSLSFQVQRIMIREEIQRRRKNMHMFLIRIIKNNSATSMNSQSRIKKVS